MKTPDNASNHEHEESRLEKVEEKIEDVAEIIVESFESAVEASLPPHLRLQAWARRRPVTHVVWRALVLLLGTSVFIAGVAMLVLPGPGWAAIFLGLVILSTEFAWAHRLAEPLRRAFNWAMERARQRAQRKQQKTDETST
ncbi:MAG: TIGR02611 family protein [Candidatus Nanopelagicales bacterium]